MDDFTANSIKEVHGLYFEQYCLRKKILLKRDEQGAFLMTNANVLRQCVLASDNIKSKINEKLRKLQRYSLSEKCSIHRTKFLERLQKQYKVNKKKWIRFNKQAKDPHAYFTDSQLSIYLYGTSPIVFTNASSIKHLLGTQKNGIQLYIFIIRRSISDLIVTDFKVPIPLISPLLEQFQQEHNCFPYNGILKRLTRKQKPNKSQECKYKISKKQLKLYFNLIFSKVVPLNIFGKINNMKKIKRTFFDLLFAPHSKTISLVPLIAKLDIFSIKWLKNIKSDRDKQCLIAKFIRWFFVGYLLKVLRMHFHITPVSSTNNERLYIPRYIWKKIQYDFIKRRISSYTLQPDVQCKGWYPPIGIYKLLPKQAGVRPIFMPRYQHGDKKHLRIILQFLKQLHMTEYGTCNFQEKWQSIVKCKRNSNAKKLYFVCCDVADAFGSIKQGILYEIIQSLCEKLPESLILKYYMVKSKIFKEDIVCYKQYFSDPNLKLSLAPGTFYAYPNRGYSQWIKKNWLLKQIEKYIFDQRVLVQNKNYIIGKGIVQGTMLSPILSDIYYNFVLHKEMATFLKAGKIIKYMDDILYVTEDEISAKQFLQLTKNGIPRYNCFFKKLKTQSNLACDGNTTVANHIIYIGYKINCTTLEVEPKPLDTDLRYAMSYITKNNMTPLATLRLRLSNVAPLKLSKFILDRRINSKETIIKILKKTCLVQAKRACILIKELFNNIKANVKNIHNVIAITNSKIARFVLKALIFRKKMKRLYMHKWNIQILCILWTSYRVIFKKDQILRKHFTYITNYPVRKR